MLREGFPLVDDKDLRRLHDKAISKGVESDIDAFFAVADARLVVDEIGMFLTWYMPRKVIDSQGVERAALPTMKKLVRFLGSRNYFDEATAERAAHVIEDVFLHSDLH